MKASAPTVQHLLNRLPDPRRATLAHIGHVVAMLARAEHTPGLHPAELAERVQRLERWLAAVHPATPPSRGATPCPA